MSEWVVDNKEDKTGRQSDLRQKMRALPVEVLYYMLTDRHHCRCNVQVRFRYQSLGINCLMKQISACDNPLTAA